jgi:hypothetical protein
MEGVTIVFMSGPFRFNKKARRRMRRFAKKVSTAADKLETESTNRTNSAATLRFLAESNLTLAKLHKKKKSKNPK